MHHADQAFGETGLDAGEVSDGEVTFVELSLGDAVLNDRGDEAVDAGSVGFIETSGGTFDGVGQGNDGGFFELRAGAGVAEDVCGDLGDVVLIGFGFAGLLEEFSALVEGAFVKVIGEGGAVVLLNDVEDLTVEVVLDAEVNAVFDVGDEDKGTHAGGEVIMGIFPRGHVFNEVLGFGELTDVVKVRADTTEGGAGTDGLGGGFGEAGDHQAVVVGAGGLNAEAAHEWMIQIRKLQP